MLVKILGATIVIASSVYFAERSLTEEKRRIDQLDAFIDIISYIRSRIDLYSMPLERIFKDIDKDKLKSVGVGKTPETFSDMLTSDDILINEESRKILSDFSASLGKSYREMQIKQCDQAIRELSIHKKRALDELPSRKKTIIALCLGVGGVAVIALI